MGPTRRAERAIFVIAVVLFSVAGSTLAAAPAAAVAAATVTVGRGDTLTSIAARNHTSVAALAAVNGITNPNRILLGAVLRLPGPTPATPGPATSAGGAPQTVVVHLGDTLGAIAARNHTTVAALAAVNGITNPNHITAGQVLRLPVSSTMAPASFNAPLPPGAPVSSPSGAANTGGLPAALRAHPDRLALIPVFKQAAAIAGVPASLLEAMCWWESGWQVGALSSSGAVGVCQIEPATAVFIRTVLLHGAALDPRVAAQNIALAAAYLGYLVQQAGGNRQLALGGYYAGLASVLKHGMSADTKNYVAGITAYARIFAAAG